jgi:predicted HAD superfamily Cof-like phosphohydrolase
MWQSKELEDVKAFNRRFNLLLGCVPGHLAPTKMAARLEFLQEELDELKRAAAANDLTEQADALVDLVYVTLGTVAMLGLPWEELWDEVQRTNMAKVRGPTKRGHSYDVTKPPGWEPPRLAEVLKRNGYAVGFWLAEDGQVLAGRDDPKPLEEEVTPW